MVRGDRRRRASAAFVAGDAGARSDLRRRTATSATAPPTRWAVRTAGDPNQIVTAVRAAVAQVDPRAPLAEIQPMTTFVDKAMAPIRFTATLIGIFAAVAVVLAAVGLYGVLSTIVRQRTAEIGMRMVFGAPRRSILQLVVGEGLKLSAVGIAAGLVGAFAITRVMASAAGRRQRHRPGDVRGDHRALRRYRDGRLMGSCAAGLAVRSDDRDTRRVELPRRDPRGDQETA